MNFVILSGRHLITQVNLSSLVILLIENLPLWHKGRVTDSHVVVLSLIPNKVEIFNFCLGLELGWKVDQNLSCQFLIETIPGLIPNPSVSAFVVKAYVLLIVIDSLDGNVKPGIGILLHPSTSDILNLLLPTPNSLPHYPSSSILQYYFSLFLQPMKVIVATGGFFEFL